MIQKWPPNGAQLAPKFHLNPEKLIWEASGIGPNTGPEKMQKICRFGDPWILKNWAPAAAGAQFSKFQRDPINDQKCPQKVTPGASFWEPVGPHVVKNAFQKNLPKNDQKKLQKMVPKKWVSFVKGGPNFAKFWHWTPLGPHFAN